MPETKLTAVRVWDLPTRLFHWVLAAAVIFSVVTAQIGGNAMAWHFRSGYLILGLLLFRLVWGFVGGRWSRFSSFVHGPGAVWRYLRGQTAGDEGRYFDVGHNPLGSFSVFALLGLLAVQVGTGLIGDDEIANVGPLNRFVATSTGIAATGWHGGWGASLIIALAVLHLAAVLFYYFVRKKNLIGPMVHGDKTLPADVPAAADGGKARAIALALALVCAATVGWVVSLGT